MSEQNGQSGDETNLAPTPVPNANEEGVIDSLSLNPNKEPVKKDDDVVEDKFPRTGNPAEDLVLGYFEKLGYKPNSPAIVAAWENGNFDLLRAELATRDDAKGASEYISLAQKGREDRILENANRVIELEKTIHNEVGGQEAWVEIRDWARSKEAFDDDERASINEMLEKGGLATKMALSYMSNKYNESTYSLGNPPSPVTTPAISGSGASFALSPQEYLLAVKELASKIGSDKVTNSSEYQNLQKRRLAWRG